jgi:hypothetical protein
MCPTLVAFKSGGTQVSAESLPVSATADVVTAPLASRIQWVVVEYTRPVRHLPVPTRGIGTPSGSVKMVQQAQAFH